MTAAAGRRVPVAVAPEAPAWVVEAVGAGGGRLVAGVEEAEALVWMRHDDPAGLRDLLERAPKVRWVQLPWAGVDRYAAAGLLDGEQVYTSAKGIYSRPVAEHAVTLALAGLRDLKRHALETGWHPQAGTSLFGAPVTIFGRGGVAAEIARLLRPFDCQVTVVARDRSPVEWASSVVPWPSRHDALGDAIVVFLALPLTPETIGFIAAAELERMRSDAWLVNVARGRHVVTDDLVAALRRGSIGGAAMDVTDPEPLPAGHPLWTLPNCLITPHTAAPAWIARPLLAAHVAENVRRFAAGEPLRSVVDPRLGY